MALIVPKSFSSFYLFFDHLWYAKMKASINWNKANCWEMGQSLPIIATWYFVIYFSKFWYLFSMYSSDWGSLQSDIWTKAHNWRHGSWNTP